MSTTPPTDVAAVVVIAHGSRADEANEAHRAVCDALAQRTGRVVAPAFLELAEPTLADAVAGLAGRGATRIVVMPYFLHPGRHLRRDIPQLVDDARLGHPGIDIEVGPLFGADAALVDVLASQLPS